jgi:hypothetical protein
VKFILLKDALNLVTQKIAHLSQAQLLFLGQTTTKQLISSVNIKHAGNRSMLHEQPAYTAPLTIMTEQEYPTLKNGTDAENYQAFRHHRGGHRVHP